MHRAETVVLKLRSPGRAKREWLEQTAERFRQGVQLGLDHALSARTSNRGKIHATTYASIRDWPGWTGFDREPSLAGSRS